MHGQNALTVDVEDYFQVEAFAGVIDRGNWDSFPRRVRSEHRTASSTFSPRPA